MCEVYEIFILTVTQKKKLHIDSGFICKIMIIWLCQFLLWWVG